MKTKRKRAVQAARLDIWRTLLSAVEDQPRSGTAFDEATEQVASEIRGRIASLAHVEAE